jgi:hypothetical protein
VYLSKEATVLPLSVLFSTIIFCGVELATLAITIGAVILEDTSLLESEPTVFVLCA